MTGQSCLVFTMLVLLMYTWVMVILRTLPVPLPSLFLLVILVLLCKILFFPFDLHKNILSIAYFTQDNLVFFVFAPHFYQIYDLLTDVLMFHGPCKDGLYPLSIFFTVSTAPQAYVVVSSTTWLQHLGLFHYLASSSLVISRLSSNLGPTVRVGKSFCMDRALSKSTQLSFYSNNNICSCSPFYIIHCNVWMSSITFVNGFRYCVLFTDDFSRYS